MKRKTIKQTGTALAAATALAMVGTASAAITIDFETGPLFEIDGTTPVTLGSLIVAIADTDGDGLIGGVLAQDSSLSGANSVDVYNAFAGQTLTAGGTIGGDRIIVTTATNNASSNPGYLGEVVSGIEYTDLAEGDLIGLFWFPDLTLASNTVGTGDFQIGGINDTTVLVTGFGGDPMLVPADGGEILIEIVEPIPEFPEFGGVPADRVTAITASAVPEPSSALLAFAGLAVPVLRRRRRD